jgi:hypothetical protein
VAADDLRKNPTRDSIHRLLGCATRFAVTDQGSSTLRNATAHLLRLSARPNVRKAVLSGAVVEGTDWDDE